MTPGTILHDQEFRYRDGETGRKYIVILNDGTCGSYVVVKATSQGRRYSNTPGCQLGTWACFFLDRGCCKLPKDTWVQLHEFYPFNAQEMLGLHFTGRMEVIDELTSGLTRDLQECALQSDDISEANAEIIRACLR